MATPTGFSINSMVSIIRQQEPNIDKEDAKEIAEQIKSNILNSLAGKRTTTPRRNTTKKKEKDTSKKEEKFRGADGKFASFNKMVESNLKEIRTDLKKVFEVNNFIMPLPPLSEGILNQTLRRNLRLQK